MNQNLLIFTNANIPYRDNIELQSNKKGVFNEVQNRLQSIKLIKIIATDICMYVMVSLWKILKNVL